jgi:hypothetical protein
MSQPKEAVLATISLTYSTIQYITSHYPQKNIPSSEEEKVPF